eukprot:CAMPEP_0176452540 /NCGR_PEP_ID=MMETSP0127-20121128/28602_1 /TAXON_ID=938130 /ORGANISM="Platyophrya macrostoma, Strain WH" /LENGTH=1000 /DNA_ID=CAMNT_0017841025 /DNA_START=38 /DNA_END=3040 /DNA_ORIENTATION=-
MEQQRIVNEFMDMGFEMPLIVEAFHKCKGNKAQMMDELIRMTEQNQKMIEQSMSMANQQRGSTGGASNEDIDINKAIELSLKEAQGTGVVFEPLNPEQRLRKKGMPVGLKNVGNTCYVNSLFQTHFQNLKFVKAIMDFESGVTFTDEEIKAAKSGANQDKKKLRLNASINLVKNLQALFASMTRSHKKYIDPTPVLNNLVDDFANPIPVGDQKDVTEFNMTFLTRVEEALQTQESFVVKKGESPHRPTHVDSPLEESLTHKNNLLLRKLSSIGDAEETFMSSMFFGKMKEFRTYIQDKQRMMDEEDSLFGAIILDITHKDLYSSLDEWLCFDIEDFRAPNGEICKAEKESWITKAPDTLFFQLQRVVFNKDIADIQKLDNPFQFEKEIYIDRFLLEHKEIATKIRTEVKALKRRLASLELALSKINSYKDTGFDILAVLGVATEFLNSQLDEKDLTEATQLQKADPVNIGILSDKDKLLTSVNTIKLYSDHLSQKKKALEAEIKQIKDEIDALYSKLKSEKYVLGSILIHDGVAGSGHYYSFIRNHDDTWMRYNDIQVSEEKEEQVFKEAIGGLNHISAYCLVYTSQKAIDKETEHIKKYMQGNMNLANELEVPKQHYSIFLKEKLRADVDLDNKKFHEEIQEYRFQTFMKNISEAYQTRYDILLSTFNSIGKGAFPFHINSFGLFLKSEIKSDSMIKWYVLDTCLQEINPNFKFKLKELKNQPKLLKILQNSIGSLGSNYSLKELELPKDDEGKIDAKLAEYVDQITGAIICLYIFEKCLTQEWIETLCAIRKLQQLNFPTTSFFTKITKNLSSILVLYLATRLEHNIAIQDFQENEALMTTLFALNKGILKQDDPQSIQVKIILNDILALQQNKFSPEALQSFKEFVYKNNTSMHGPEELGKALGDKKSAELEKRLEIISSEGFEPYKWTEITEQAYAHQIKKQFDNFSANYKAWVNFHNSLHSSKTPLKQEERAKSFPYAKEEPPKEEHPKEEAKAQ